jgi:UDP-N-acetylglucosamine 2-epimerase
MLKVVTVVGTRPEVIRLSRIIAKLDQHCDHKLVHTGQNYDYELNEVFFRELSIRAPDFYLNAAGETPAETIGRVIIEVDKVLAQVQPDAMLILGDTNSCLAAIAAKRRKIPIFHMEAGNRCFDFRVPEEINRKIVDHIADINLTYSSIAREYLLREGLPPDQVIKTGSPMREVLKHYEDIIERSNVLSTLGISNGDYFVVSVHREENVDTPENIRKILLILDRLAVTYGQPIIVSTHPRTRKRIDGIGLQCHPLVHLCKPFGFPDYIKLQMNARAVLSDSGTITEEASILNFPALNLREIHERPEGFEEATTVLTGLDADVIMEAMRLIDSQPRGANDRLLTLVADYAPLNVSDKIVRILFSYAPFVRRRVWRVG